MQFLKHGADAYSLLVTRYMLLNIFMALLHELQTDKCGCSKVFIFANKCVFNIKDMVATTQLYDISQMYSQ